MDTLIFMTVSASLLLLAAFALRALFGRVLPRRAFMALCVNWFNPLVWVKVQSAFDWDGVYYSVTYA